MLVSYEEVEEIIQTCELENWYAIFFNKSQSSRTHHSFIPKENKFLMKTISKDSHVASSVLWSSSLVLNPGMYVACMYEGEWFIGAIIEVCDETDDAGVSFMKQDNWVLYGHREKIGVGFPKEMLFVEFLHYLPTVMELDPIIFLQMNCKKYKINLVICRQ